MQSVNSLAHFLNHQEFEIECKEQKEEGNLTGWEEINFI